MKNLLRLLGLAFALACLNTVSFAQVGIGVLQSDPVITRSFKNQGLFSTTQNYNANDVVSITGSSTLYYAPTAIAASTTAPPGGAWAVFGGGTSSGGTVTIDGVSCAIGSACTVNVTASPDVSNVTMELPYTDNLGNFLGSGSTVTDSSGATSGATLAASPNTPVQYSYGEAFLDTGTASTPYAAITTPLTSWLTWGAYICPPVQVQTTGTAIGGNPSNPYPTLVGSTNPSAGLDILGVAYGAPSYAQGDGNANQVSIFNAATSASVTAPIEPMTGCGVAVVTLGTTGATPPANVDHIYYADDNGRNALHEVSYSVQGASAALVGLSGGNTYWLGIGKGGTNSAFGWRGVRLYDEFTSTFSTPAIAQQLAQHILAQVKARTTFPTYPKVSGSRAATIVCACDSIGAGYSGYNWLASLSTNTAYAIVNEGIGGSTSLETVKDSALKWEGDIVKGNSYLFHQAVTNDANLGATVASAISSASEDIVKGHRAGAKVIIGAMITRTGSAGVGGTLDAWAQSYNAYWRQNWQKQLADGWFDPAQFAVLGASGAYSNTNCLQTGVHPTGTSATSVSCGQWGATTGLSGYGLYQYTLQALINSLDGSTYLSPTVTTSNAYVSTPADNYVSQIPTAAATFTLTEACGRNKPQVITNAQSGAFNITVSPVNSETITGSTLVAPLATATFTPQITGGAASTTGGCYWLRTE